MADYVDEIVRSGLPGLRIYRGRALRAQLNGYLDRIVDTDFEDQGLSVRCPETLRRWIAAYAAEARLRHLRLHGGGREVDLIVERNDQRIIAIEVKLGRTVNDDDVRHLHWLRGKMGEDMLDAVVIHTGPEAYRRKDGVAVVPAALLGC